MDSRVNRGETKTNNPILPLHLERPYTAPASTDNKHTPTHFQRGRTRTKRNLTLEQATHQASPSVSPTAIPSPPSSGPHWTPNKEHVVVVADDDDDDEHDSNSHIDSVLETEPDDEEDNVTWHPGRLAKGIKKELRRRVLHTTPSWFSVNMGVGITSILIFNLAYQFPGSKTIANVIFAINVVLFFFFLALSIARYATWPRLFPTMLFHSSQSLFLGTFSMGWGTIVNMIALSLAPAWGDRWVIIAWACWWADVVISLLVAVGVTFVVVTRHKHTPHTVYATWLLPCVSPIVTASSGGIVAEVLAPLNASHARLTIIVSYICLGVGLPTAILIMSLYYGRLSLHKIPPAALIVSMFLPLGPCGQGAYALLQASKVLRNLTISTGIAPLGGTQYSVQSALVMADSIYAGSIVTALIMWGFGLFWFSLAISTILDMAVASRMDFTMGWWGSVFPIGTLAASAGALGSELDSPFFRVVSTALTLLVTILCTIMFGFTLYKGATGELFFSPCLAEVGGEPPAFLPPTRKYEYVPRPGRRESHASGAGGRESRSHSRMRSLSRDVWEQVRARC